MRARTALSLFLAAGLGYQLGARRDPRESVFEADRDFDRVTAEKGVDGWVSFFAEDGRMIGTAGKIIQGPKQVRENMESLFADRANSLRWHPEYAEVAKSGDLAFSIGSSILQAKDPTGILMQREGRYLTVWRKYQDGKWKVAVDIGASGPSKPAR